MGAENYELPWQAATGNVELVKKIIFVFGILVFGIIVLVTLNVFERAQMGFETCVSRPESTPIYEYGMHVLSAKTASAIISAYVGDVRPAGNTLEVCGTAFVFEDANGTKYNVCENGEIYKYRRTCTGLFNKSR